GLVFDSDGNLYGTTVNGAGGTCTQGCGVIFKLTPNTGGNWTQTVLHNLAGRPDGGNSYAGLTLDSAGSLYGTASYGGQFGQGIGFELVGSTFKVIHDFHLSSGATPNGNVVFDSAGNLYGTTFLGGHTGAPCEFDVPFPGCGVVFKLTPASAGGWTYSVP